MSKISPKLKRIWGRFFDKEYRDGYISDAISDRIAIQIASLRQDRGWTQTQLAEKIGTQQTAICRHESGENAPTLSTLKKIASAYDVALVVKFVPFSEFLSGESEPIDRPIPSFSEDGMKETSVPRLISVSTKNPTWFSMAGDRDIRHHNRVSSASYKQREYTVQ